MKQSDKELMIELYEAKSQYGNTYFHGRLEGGVKVFMQKDKKKISDKGEPLWSVFIQK